MKYVCKKYKHNRLGHTKVEVRMRMRIDGFNYDEMVFSPCSLKQSSIGPTKILRNVHRNVYVML